MYNLLRFIFFFLIDFFASVFCKVETRNGIALIRLDRIGDFILWLDSAKEIRRIYPHQKIVLIVNAACSDLARVQPYWNDVWEIDLRRFMWRPLYRWSMLRKIRKAGFSIAIQPTYSRVFFHGDSVIRVSGATERIGFISDSTRISDFELNISNRFYTRLLPSSNTPLTELERNAEFISQLSGKKYIAKIPKLIFPESNNAIAADNYIVLFPGASSSVKCWGIDNFAKIGDALYSEFGFSVVLAGGTDDLEKCRILGSKLNCQYSNFAGKTTLIQLAAIIRGARLLICNDTSAVHMAAAVGTPSVCILGGGHHGRFLPYPDSIVGVKPLVADYKMPCYYCSWQCTQPHVKSEAVPCVANVTVADVLLLARQALGSHAGNKSVSKLKIYPI